MVHEAEEQCYDLYVPSLYETERVCIPSLGSKLCETT